MTKLLYYHLGWWPTKASKYKTFELNSVEHKLSLNRSGQLGDLELGANLLHGLRPQVGTGCYKKLCVGFLVGWFYRLVGSKAWLVRCW